eukprot:5122881-Amphidinium_carterae.1
MSGGINKCQRWQGFILEPSSQDSIFPRYGTLKHLQLQSVCIAVTKTKTGSYKTSMHVLRGARSICRALQDGSDARSLQVFTELMIMRFLAYGSKTE